MVIRRVGPLSLAKVSGALYALMGLIFGAIISLISVVGSAFMPKDAGLSGMLFGVGAIVVLPIFYGVLGFIMSLIMAGLYNLIAGWVGGVEIDLQ
ncbi:MAG TPA: hypothetical protein VE974_03905 [Thermoanaerobaculia bacterium]|nr:hypothetical protein [Thermoanaerobaculia bacterium]